MEFEKWRAIRAGVGGVGSVGGVLVCLRGWRGCCPCVDSMLTWVAC